VPAVPMRTRSLCLLFDRFSLMIIILFHANTERAARSVR
jgi:hypothetical protein